MMSGQLNSKIGAYDNASEFAASVPTFAHYLRARGLPDLARRQDALRRRRPAARLRGAADHRHLPRRLRLDAELGRSRRALRLVVPQHGQRARTPASPRSSNQLDYDDEVGYPGRAQAARPRPHRPTSGRGSLTVSFTHPHDPYVARQRVLGPLRRRRRSRLPDRRRRSPSPSSTRTAAACDT